MKSPFRPWIALVLLAALLACGPRPQTPLAKAAFEGDDARVRELLARGADPKDPEVPLILAARAGHVAVIRTLIHAGADSNQRGGVNDWTVLMHAVHKDQEGAAAALLEGGAFPNETAAHGETALMMAAGYGYTGMVRVLLAHGADPRISDVHGGTALDNALSGVFDLDRITTGSCQTDTVRVLLDAAPDLAQRVNGWPEKVARLARCREVLQLVESKRGPRTH